MELTILMPCLNEVETIATCIKKAKNFLMEQNIEGEILISDNGSSDGSQHIAEELGARVVHTEKRGYGAALLNGLSAAKGRYVIMGDADDSYDFSSLNIFVQKLREGYDLVMGNRFKGGIEPGAMPFLNKYLGNPVLSFIGRLFYKCPIGDFHCGLRGMNKNAMAQINLQAEGMEFASEMVIKASLNRLKITEVNTILSPDGRSRPPHLRKWRDGWRHLRLLLLFCPRWLFLYPGLFFVLLGTALMTTLSLGSIQFGEFRLGIHTLLFTSMLPVIGIQAICFSLFGGIFANDNIPLSVDQRVENILKKFTLERGILLGVFLITLGIAGTVSAFLYWAHVQFGELRPDQMMRLAIPAVTLVIAGIQIIMSSFFMNLLIHYQDAQKKIRF